MRARTRGAAFASGALALVLVFPAAPTAPAAATATEWWHDAYGISSAWSTTRGDGVQIAIIDSGIGHHPALDSHVVNGEDFSGDGSSNGRTPVSDHADHGTIVASLALGSAPDAQLLAISIGFHSDREVADAVIWAVDHGADVINLSLTRNTLDWPRSWDDAFLYAEEHDVVVVTAAGNRAGGTERVGAPATMPGVLVVGGLSRGGTASFGASSQGITIGVSAPSEGLVGATPGGGYRAFNGTSGAAPIVAGVVALVRAAHPELDAANVINRVLATARDAGPAGPDVSYGHGILDAAAAVRGDVDAVAENPLGTMAEWIRLYRRADSEQVPIPVRDRGASPPDVEIAPPEIPIASASSGLVDFQIMVLPWIVTGMLGLILIGCAAGLVRHFRSPRSKH